MKKNIWLINYHAYPPGTSKWTRHFDLFKNLVDKYDFICFGGDYIHDTGKHILREDELKREEIKEGIKYIVLKRKKKKNIFSRFLCYIYYFFQILRLSKEIQKKPDVIIGSSPDLLMGLCAYFLSKRYKARFIFEIRDIWPETLVELNVISKKSLIYFIFRKLELFLYKKADAIIILPPGAKHYLNELNVNLEKIFYINNGVDIKKFENNLKKYERLDILPKKKFNIIYTGALSLNNGLDEFIESAKILESRGYKDIFFNIFGKGTEEEKLIKKSQSLKNIKFYGSVSKEIIPSLLSKADLLFFSFHNKDLYRKYGISPNKLFEYLAAKKPILFSCDSYNDPVKENKCGISLKKSLSEDIVGAILEIKDKNETERKEIGERAYNYVLSNFEMKKLSQKLEECIEFTIKDRS